MKSDFSDAEDPQHEGAVHVHVHSIKLYVSVFLVLITLTVITVATSYVDIDGFIAPGTPAGAGGFNLGLAMIIATTKAFFVVTWFMHLKDDNRFNALVFVGSLLFAGIFLAYTMNDTQHRGETDPYNGVYVLPGTGERAPGGIDHVLPGEEPELGIAVPEAAGTADESGAVGAHVDEPVDGAHH
ncbi:MAG: cytochrome C oxidase subunit IV family protein [Myxococcota bacterium]|nr:cytochrome C oxidase subunit IV family protein [Myxococcota bacterium]